MTILEHRELFQRELRALINKHGVDNELETPDFILAEECTQEVGS